MKKSGERSTDAKQFFACIVSFDFKVLYSVREMLLFVHIWKYTTINIKDIDKINTKRPVSRKFRNQLE